MSSISVLLQTFYVNLDLTSYHGPIRPPRCRQESSAVPATPSSRFPSSPATGSLSPSLPYQSNEDNNNNEADADDTADRDHVQILGLHTRNPIVSYQNHVFSCSWADLIGTELLFAHPQEEQETPSLKRGKDFDLIAANSVKILSRRANLISSSGMAESGSLGVSLPGSPYPSGPQTNQARFLQRLTNVKRSKGERDTVRTVFSLRRTQNIEERLRGWARTEEQIAEIQRLNRGALQGDMNALAELEKLCAQVGPPQDGDTTGTTTGFSTLQQQYYHQP